ncbi:MAG TPA: NirD/YgiW/YdeI family stress tolerance protein [Candidatus Avisuccinivibrio pullicola]|nr:NirD/YgiW/YdeI family stress tolerance protein [Candidatus Avisuccinivibrio pullicola]
MKKLALVSVIAVALTSAAVMAAPQGFGGGAPAAAPGAPAGFNNAAPNTIASVLASAYDDQVVTLEGRLTNYLGEDHYEFTDAAGDRIEIELDDDQDWSFISKDMLIRITGDVDKDLLSTTIDVKRAEPVQP